MNVKAVCFAGLAAAFLGCPAFAHHSFAIFDQTQVLTRTGTVVEFEWINPHAWLHLRIVDDNGNAATWSFEGGSTNQLANLGWASDSFRPGEQVEIGYRPMKDGSRGGQIMAVTLPDGRKVCSNRGCG